MRMERDSIGEMEIESDVYYGIQTMRAVQNFPITGSKLCKEFIVGLAVLKKAAAKANMKTGQLRTDVGAAIVQAATEIMEGKWHEQFVVDCIQGGAGTSMNMNANEVIANLAIEKLGGKKGDYSLVSPNNHVNMAQSTNDIMPSAIRLAAISKGNKLLQEIVALENNLDAKSQEFASCLKMGRTHLQDAVPITLGQEFAAYAMTVKRARKRINDALQNFYNINMGATAVGTGLNADPEYIEEVVNQISTLTGETFRSSPNLVDATQNTDDLAALSGALKVCALSLSKIANDLRLMASGPRAGLSEIKLPARQPGSSIMPGKVNPVIPETMNQVAFQVIGNDLAISLAVEAGQFELNVMEPVMAYNLFNSLSMLTSVIKVLNEKCITGIEANFEGCEQKVKNSIGIITALSPHIGYEKAASIAKEALEKGMTVLDLVKEKNLLPDEQLEIILSPGEMCKPGIPGKQFLFEHK